MNPTLRRGIPWAVSLVLHAALLLIPARMGMLTRARPEERRIDLVFDQPAIRGSSPAARLPARDEVDLPAGAAPPVPRSLAASPLPSPSQGPPAPLDDRLVDLVATDTAALPTARDVLADLPAPSAVTLDTASAVLTEQALADVSTAQPTLVWQGPSRRIFRSPSPDFPRVMSRAGQEGECIGKITFDPAGNATRVEIVRSSGYPEIDASIAAALRYWRAAQSPGRTDSLTVSYRLRLERRD